MKNIQKIENPEERRQNRRRKEIVGKGGSSPQKHAKRKDFKSN